MNTKINLGAIAVEVKLVKTSSEPKGSQWETKTIGAPSLADEINASAVPSPALDAAVRDHTDPTTLDDPLGAQPQHRTLEDLGRAIGGTEPTPEPPKPTVLRGVTNDEGEFVDLTEQLAEIDERVKLDGMEIVAAIGAKTIARERVRGSQFVQPLDTTSKRACAMLFAVLSATDRALAVRWTKRTNQALGIIVASKSHDCLLLLEVEFAANMKAAPAKARLGDVTRKLTGEELDAAANLVRALEGRRADLDDVVDDRRRLHAELLEAAREGAAGEFEIVPDAPEIADDLSAAFAGAQA